MTNNSQASDTATTEQTFHIPATDVAPLVREDIGRYMRYQLAYEPPRDLPQLSVWAEELDYPGVRAIVFLAAGDNFHLRPLLQSYLAGQDPYHALWGEVAEPKSSPPIDSVHTGWRYDATVFYSATLKKAEEQALKWVRDHARRVSALLAARAASIAARQNRIQKAHETPGQYIKPPSHLPLEPIWVDDKLFALRGPVEGFTYVKTPHYVEACQLLGYAEPSHWVRAALPEDLEIIRRATPPQASSQTTKKKPVIRVTWGIDVNLDELKLTLKHSAVRHEVAVAASKQVQAQYFQAPRDNRWTFEVKVDDTTCVVDMLTGTVYDINPKLA